MRCSVTTPGQALFKYVLTKSPEAVLVPATAKHERVRENTTIADASPLPPEAVARLEAMFS